MSLSAGDYRPRDAEHAVLPRVIEEHLYAFLETARRHSDGASLPTFVEQEFRDFLTCVRSAPCRELYGQVRGGHVYIVDVDIEKFFDEIPHEPLLEAVAEWVADGSVLRLVRLFLEALIQDGYRLVRPRAGTRRVGW